MDEQFDFVCGRLRQESFTDYFLVGDTQCGLRYVSELFSLPRGGLGKLEG